MAAATAEMVATEDDYTGGRAATSKGRICPRDAADAGGDGDDVEGCRTVAVTAAAA